MPPRRVEVERKAIDVGSPFAFRQHDAVRPARHHGGEVAERQSGVERVDANIDFLTRIARIEHFSRDAAGGDLMIGRDRIFQVENQRIGRRLLAAFEFSGAVAGDEQE